MSALGELFAWAIVLSPLAVGVLVGLAHYNRGGRR